MTDFIADLETELVAAARRRATRRHVPRLRLVPAIAAVAAIALFVLAVARLGGSPGPADEPPVPTLGEAVVVKLPAATPMVVATCSRDSGWSAYAPGDAPLGIFARPRSDGDALPRGTEALPAGFADGKAARRTGLGDVWLVPAFGVGEPCGQASDASAAGTCLVVGDAPPLAGCFSEADIADGRAIMFVSSGHVAGIAPDDVQAAEVNGVIVPVRDNAYEAELPGVAAGDEVRVRFGPSANEACRPSQAVYDAAPELRQPPTGNPPAELEEAMAQLGSTGTWRPFARAADLRGGLEVWVTPDLPCDRSGAEAERVCILPQGGSLLCDTPAALERRGAWIEYPRREGRGLAGIAPRGTLRVVWRSGDATASVPMADRVFGGMITGGPYAKVNVRFLH
jgi:hypothetical protein